MMQKKGVPNLADVLKLINNGLLNQMDKNADEDIGIISIILPVYNGIEYLSGVLNSIILNTDTPFRLIIIDDASDDPLVLEYLSNFTKAYALNSNQIFIIRNKENLGFVKSVNLASKLSQSHFVILNSDTEVPKGWLKRIIQPILSDDSVASVTPFSNSASICSFPNFCEDNSLFLDLRLGVLDQLFQRVFSPEIIELPTAVGFCMAVNNRVWKEIGGFDERYGLGYGEENDWSMRAYSAGYKNVIATNLFVYHFHGGSFGSEKKRDILKENLPKVYQSHPNYAKLVQDFIHKDPLLTIRNLVEVMAMSHLVDCECNLSFFDNEQDTCLENKPLEARKVLNFNIDETHPANVKILSANYATHRVEFLFNDDKQIVNLFNFLGIRKIDLTTLISGSNQAN